MNLMTKANLRREINFSEQNKGQCENVNLDDKIKSIQLATNEICKKMNKEKLTRRWITKVTWNISKT